MTKLVQFFAARRKAVAALVAVVLAWVQVVNSAGGPITRAEWLALAVGIAGVFGVHAVANDNQNPAPK